VPCSRHGDQHYCVVMLSLSCELQTEYEGQAKKYMDVVEQTDAIVTVGGDGTVSEVIFYFILCFIFLRE